MYFLLKDLTKSCAWRGRQGTTGVLWPWDLRKEIGQRGDINQDWMMCDSMFWNPYCLDSWVAGKGHEGANKSSS